MIVSIITPEKTIFHGEAEILTVPGVLGEFQILKNHAAIVSSLKKGFIKIGGVPEKYLNTIKKHFSKDKGVYQIEISGGLLEMKDNKTVVLIE